MFALADCNNFYCSCERLFRPDLEGKPVIVLSNNDGCAIARSEEAKAIGIQMGTPEFMIRELVKSHNVTMFSSNYTLYGDISRRVTSIYRMYVKEIEEYSIDESFLSLHGYDTFDVFAYAAKIRATVKQWVGIPICIGVASTKTLAKAANRYAKKMNREQGVFVITDDRMREKILRWLPVGDIWGIGRQYATWLQENGVTTAWELAHANESWIRQKMGVVGVRLVKELNGISCLTLEELAPQKKGLCTSRSFGKLLTEKADIASAVATYATRCGERLRKDGICTSAIQVFAYTNPHRTQDKQYHGTVTIPLHQPTNFTGDLIHYALKGLQMIYKPKLNYMKAGVMCLDMVPQGQIQQSLFAEQQQDGGKAAKAMLAIDAINGILGKDKVRFAAAGYQQPWKLRNEFLSPCYTTSLNEVCRIHLTKDLTLSHVSQRQNTVSVKTDNRTAW